MQLISFNNWVTAPNNWQFVFWRFILFFLSLLTTQQCVTHRKNLTLSSMTFLSYQFIALTTSKGKQYFSTVFFCGEMVYEYLHPRQKRGEQNLNHHSCLISIERWCHQKVASAMSQICHTQFQFSEFWCKKVLSHGTVRVTLEFLLGCWKQNSRKLSSVFIGPIRTIPRATKCQLYSLALHWCLPAFDRAGNRALTMINLNCLHFCFLLRKSFHL